MRKDEPSLYELILSGDQSKAFSAVKKFINSPGRREYLLKGCAGSGKSYLTARITEYAKDERRMRVAVTAPTNEAVKVISEYTGDDLRKTIYSLLGYVLVEKDDGSPILEKKGRCTFDSYDLVILDESSMLQDDIYAKLKQQLAKCNTKVLYVGDSYQLPPVNGGKEAKPFGIKNFSELKEIKRVQAGNPILETVAVLRSNIDAGSDSYPRQSRTGDTGSITFTRSRSEFVNSALDLFDSPEFRANPNHVKIVAYTNRTVDEMNLAVRRRIYGEQASESYVVGEKLLADKPILSAIDKAAITYNTGERLTVLKARKMTHDATGLVYWKMSVTNSDGTIEEIMVVDQESVDVYWQVLTSFAKKAKSDQAKGDKRAWFRYFHFKNTFSSVKYAYAMTVHRMQGSTVTNVFVHEPDIDKLKWDHRERRQLKYVAFTRASKNLTVLID